MKQFILKDILNNMYYWQFRAESGFDLDLKEATKYGTKEDAKKELEFIKAISDFDRIIEIKEVYIF